MQPPPKAITPVKATLSRGFFNGDNYTNYKIYLVIGA
nr:MAG TPA: hypothetical protein [Bacteriophage sp.]